MDAIESDEERQKFVWRNWKELEVQESNSQEKRGKEAGLSRDVFFVTLFPPSSYKIQFKCVLKRGRNM